jgi:hypothetical protein
MLDHILIQLNPILYARLIWDTFYYYPIQPYPKSHWQAFLQKSVHFSAPRMTDVSPLLLFFISPSP